MEFITLYADPQIVQHAYWHIVVSVALWALVIVAILLDLWDGLYTAKATGQRIKSNKLRITIAKISEYWRLMLIGFVIDTLGILFPFYSLPYLSILLCIGLVGVEAKSMLEHAQRRKSKTTGVVDIIKEIVECSTGDKAQALVDFIKNLKSEDNGKD